MKTKLLFVFFLMLLNLTILANGIGIVDGTVGTCFTVTESETTVRVTDQIAIITCTTIFVNNTGYDTPFKFGFPLNDQANPLSIRWFYKDLWYEASVSSNKQDNTLPGEPGEGIHPALRDFLGHYPVLFSPQDTVEAGETILMELTYVELLPYYLGKVSFSQKNDISQLQNEPVLNQSLTFRLQSERDVLSVHLYDLIYNLTYVDDEVILRFADESRPADFDYLIEYELASDQLGVNTFSTYLTDDDYPCDDNGNGYFSLVIEPESNINTEVIDKNFTLIIDRSGSMSGSKINQAKEAARFIVQNLNLGDYFNIIDFHSKVMSFSPGLVEYTPETENQALAYINNIYAGGSTNISGALGTAIDQFDVVNEDMANIIIFMTDGQANVGISDREGILQFVKDKVAMTETGVFLFTLGIGQDVDKGLLTLLARQNSGLVQFVDPSTLEEELVKFFLSVNNPVLLNIQISFDPAVISEIYPFPLPNLYKGQQLIVSGRYNESAAINMHLEGTAFNYPVSYDFDLTLSDSTVTKFSFLPKIWAKQKIDALSTEYYLAETDEERETIASLIDSLSVCYGVVALEFSSFEDDGGGPVGVEETLVEPVEQMISLFPTRCEDQITFQILEPVASNTVFIRILNTRGQAMYMAEKQLDDNQSVSLYELGDLPAGMYILIVRVDNKRYTARFIKD